MKISNIDRLAVLILIALMLQLNACTSTQQKPADEQPPEQFVEDTKETAREKQQTDLDAVVPESRQSIGEGAESKSAQTDKSEEAEPKSKDVEIIPRESIESVVVEPIEKQQEAQKIPDKKPASEEIATKTQPAEDTVKATKELVSTGPDHFVVTAEEKDQRHPFFGKGHEMGFNINGIPGMEIAMQRNKAYRIDVDTDPKHDVYISTKEIGWGSTPWSEGVEGMYTYKGTITVKPDNNTPEYLYYSCRNHPYMGGKIHILNPGESAKISTPQTTAKLPTAKKVNPTVSVSAVNQKIMFADMILNSKNTQRILASKNDDAIGKHEQGKKNLQNARADLAAGNNESALKAAESAITLLKEASKLVPDEDTIAESKKRYEEQVASLHNFEESHARSFESVVKKQGKDAAVSYNKQEVDSLKKEASQLAEKSDFENASLKLGSAQRLVTTALQQMLHKQTIVYDLNFETPQEEYEYELRRYIGYEELIPVAIEVKQPNEGTIGLMNTYAKKGKEMHDKAVEKSKAGDFTSAIGMLQEATKEVRRALRMVGVMQ